MLELIISFIAILNPFALFIYTLPLKKEQYLGDYISILVRASLISFIIFSLFALSGDAIFTRVLNVDFNSFRIFGGLVLIGFALSFIVQGKESFITTKGELSKLASEVALPFMVGAGTITLSIVLGRRLGATNSVLALALIMSLNLAIILALAVFRQKLRPAKMQEVLDKNLEILLRLNGFVVGAFGVDLVVSGVKGLFS